MPEQQNTNSRFGDIQKDNNANDNNGVAMCEHVKPFSADTLKSLPKSDPVSLPSTPPINKDAAISQIHQVYDPQANKTLNESLINISIADSATQVAEQSSSITSVQGTLSTTKQNLQQNMIQLKEANDKIFENKDKMTSVGSEMRRMEVDAKNNATNTSWKDTLKQSQQYQNLQQEYSSLQQNQAALVQAHDSIKATALQNAQTANELTKNLPPPSETLAAGLDKGKNLAGSAFTTTPPQDACGISIDAFTKLEMPDLKNLETIVMTGLPAFPGLPSIPAIPNCDGLAQNIAASAGIQLSNNLPNIPNMPALPNLPPLPALPAFGSGSANGAPALIVPPNLPATPSTPALPAVPGTPNLPSIAATTLDNSLGELLNRPEADFLKKLMDLSKIQPNFANIPQVSSSVQAPQMPTLQMALTKVASGFSTPNLPSIPALPALPQTPAMPACADLTSFAGSKIPLPSQLLALKDTLPAGDFCRYCAFWTDIQSRISTYQQFTDIANAAQVYNYSSIAQLITAQASAAANQTTIAKEIITKQAGDLENAKNTETQTVFAAFKNRTEYVKQALSDKACPNPQCPLSALSSPKSASQSEIATTFSNPEPSKGILSPEPKIVVGDSTVVPAYAEAVKLKMGKNKTDQSPKVTELHNSDLEDACIDSAKMVALENSLKNTTLVTIYDVDSLSDHATMLAAEIQRKFSAQGISVIMTTTGRPIVNPVTSALLEKSIYKDGGKLNILVG